MYISLPSILFVVLLVLKLVGVITWSWWWVTAPLWIGAAIWLAVVLFFVVCAVAFYFADEYGHHD